VSVGVILYVTHWLARTATGGRDLGLACSLAFGRMGGCALWILPTQFDRCENGYLLSIRCDDASPLFIYPSRVLGKSDSQVLPPRRGQLGVAARESSFLVFGFSGSRLPCVWTLSVPAVTPIGAACYCCLDVNDGGDFDYNSSPSKQKSDWNVIFEGVQLL